MKRLSRHACKAALGGNGGTTWPPAKQYTCARLTRRVPNPHAPQKDCMQRDSTRDGHATSKHTRQTAVMRSDITSYHTSDTSHNVRQTFAGKYCYFRSHHHSYLLRYDRSENKTTTHTHTIDVAKCIKTSMQYVRTIAKEAGWSENSNMRRLSGTLCGNNKCMETTD